MLHLLTWKPFGARRFPQKKASIRDFPNYPKQTSGNLEFAQYFMFSSCKSFEIALDY